jgi:pimeloyl-ACP methyl ester carboxylesterase
MSAADLEAYRADPVWLTRVAAAFTIPGSRAEATAGIAGASKVRVSPPRLLGAAACRRSSGGHHGLDERLTDGRIMEISGAKHAAHHTHPDAVVEAVRAFLA